MFDFGDRKRREQPLENPLLRTDQREYESKYSLFVTCAWRLDSENAVVFGWADVGDGERNTAAALLSVEGQRVVAVNLREPSLDLTVSFSDGRHFRVFCDNTRVDDDNNYSFKTPTGTYVVAARSNVSFEPAR